MPLNLLNDAAGSGINTTYQTPCQVDEADQGTGDPVHCALGSGIEAASQLLQTDDDRRTIDRQTSGSPRQMCGPKNHARRIHIVRHGHDGHDSFTSERGTVGQGDIGDEAQHTRVYISY